MNKQNRLNWLANYFHQNANESFDILNAKFVDDYVEATGAKLNYQMFGAHKCTQLSKDLSSMYAECLLTRHTVGVGDGLSSQGFPKWVYSYKLLSKTS